MKNYAHQLVEFLVNGNFINQEQAEEFQRISDSGEKAFEEIILEKEILNERELGQIIADIQDWKFVDLNEIEIDKTALRLIPEHVAKGQIIVCFEKSDNQLKVAMTNPDDMALLHLLQKTLGYSILPYFSMPSMIEKAFQLYQKELKGEFDELIQAQSKEVATGEAPDSAIIKIVNLLLKDGYQKKASDIHIEPHQHNTVVRFRIDGVMHDIVTIPKISHDLIITRIKILSQLRTDEHQTPQDGKFHYEFEGEEVDVRVSILPTTKGENVVMRLLSEKSRRFSLEDLGLGEHDFSILRSNIKKPWGMILVTGPTGSGKTTTLYAILKILNRPEVNIATIEDPVEYNIDNLTQIQVNPRANLTFAAGLRSLVRQDPNIIMVGEIRDEETAMIAVNSAMTGHLVLSTLHTNDAATTLPRLLDMGVQPFLVSSTVNIAIGQRLIRKICERCVESYEITADELRKKIPETIVERLCKGEKSILLYKGNGCNHCQHSGYSGRLGVFELMEMTDDIRELIIKNADADMIKAKAIANGMTTMLDDAIGKVLRGVTTLEEILRAVKY